MSNITQQSPAAVRFTRQMAGWALGGLTAGALLLAIGGCNSSDITHGEDFTPQGASTSVGRFAENQSAVAAAQDSALHEQHFDGSHLNSLGEVQLDLIIKGTPITEPVTVHLDFARDLPDEALAARETAAAAYIQNCGVPKSQIEFVKGPNTAKTMPTAGMMPLAYKSEGGAPTAVSADAGEAGAASSGASGMFGGK